jgi:hypothetical protein
LGRVAPSPNTSLGLVPRKKFFNDLFLEFLKNEKSPTFKTRVFWKKWLAKLFVWMAFVDLLLFYFCFFIFVF